ncbi:hypothetical protein VTL71DRAFT_334 [Oculimacula yallundae]|uniref:Kinesin light chain n=1 Tax=Oculimacula yallundae TaxID=86028 RepID=A0ABR4D214_9HELO
MATKRKIKAVSELRNTIPESEISVNNQEELADESIANSTPAPEIKPLTRSDCNTEAVGDSTSDLETKPSTEPDQTIESPTKATPDLENKPATEPDQTIESPTKSTPDLEVEPATESDQTIESPTKSTPDLEVEPATESHQTIESPTKATPDLENKPATEPDQTIESPTKDTPDLEVEPATEPDQAIESPTKGTPDLKVEPATEPDQAIESPTKDTPDVEVKPATESDQIIESAAGDATAPSLESLVESDQVVEHAAEIAPDSVIEVPIEPSDDSEPAEQEPLKATEETVVPASTPEIDSNGKLSDSLSHLIITAFDTATKRLVDQLDHVQSAVPEPSIPEIEEQIVTVEEDSAPALIFEVPHPRNPKFVGRTSALSQLFGIWNPGQTSHARIAIAGLGGIGKTELAIEFVHRVHHISPSTPILWFGPDEERWDRDFGREFILVLDTGDSFENLLVKNADSERLIDQLQSFEGTIILLVRSVQHASELTGSHGICELDELEVEASIALFRNSLSPDASTAPESQMQEVVDLMAYLPRAIVQAAEVINKTGMKVSQFLEMYQRGDGFKLRMLGKLDTISSPEHNASVIGTGVFDVGKFRKTYHKFSQFLYQLYFLGGDAVPWQIFSSGDSLDMAITLVVLKGHFLVTEDTSDETYSLHPLVYLAIQNSLGSSDDAVGEANSTEERKWYEEVIIMFSKEYLLSDQHNREWNKQCFAHLIATCYHREAAFFKRKGTFVEALKMIELARHTLGEPVPPEQFAIVQDHVTLLFSLARYRDMHEVLQRTTPEPGAGMLWKKRMQAKLEQADCANQYDTAVEMFRQILLSAETSDESETSTSLSMDDLGMALMYKGRYRDAASECRKALAERKISLGSSYPDTLTSCHNLAEILKRSGQVAEALRYIQGALVGRENILGPDHPDTLHSRFVKACILRCKAVSSDEFDEAETLVIGCMDRLGSFLPSSHPLVVACRSELALVMFARGNFEMAEQMNQEALRAREQGPWLEASTHPDTLTSKHQLAEVLRLKEGCKSADLLSEAVANDRTAILTNGTLTGQDFHPDQLTSLHHRAIVLSGLKQHLPALQKIDLALTARKTILGADHPDVYLSMTWKGEIMRSQLPRYQSERVQALDTIEILHKQALEGLSWIFGPEHQSTLQCATNLALLKNEKGGHSKAEAEDLYRRIYKSYQRNLGDLHPETLKAKGRYAESLRASSSTNHSQAKKLWRESCAGFANVYGPNAWVTIKAYKEYEKFLRAYPDS